MKNNHLKLITAGILSTTLLGVSTPAIALETPKPTTTQNPAPSWGLDRIDQVDLPLSGTFTSEGDAGKGVSVYIVDTGIRTDHIDFAGRISEGFSVADNGDTSDCKGHGTHVAGTIAGTTYGIAKSATIIPVRVFNNECVGGTEYIISGLEWIKEHHSAGTPAVVNLSVSGMEGEFNDRLEAAVKSVIDDGITVVAGSGNYFKDACNFSPARIPAVITVAASTRGDQTWEDLDEYGEKNGSNFGKCVDIYAPGASIFSTYHTSNAATEIISGTSMASPHVAGAAAVILSRNPTLTPAQVTDSIINTSTVGLLKDLPPETPNRLLFLSAETVAPDPGVTVPGAPINVVAGPGALPGSATVQWNKGEDGGSEIGSHAINIYENDIKYSTRTVAGKADYISVDNLPEGKTYTFSVTARNAIGIGPESERSQPVKIPSKNAPSAPTSIVAWTGTAVGWANVKWTQGDNGGSPILRYTLHAYEDGVKRYSYDFPPEYNDFTVSIAELPQGKNFTFTVTATNTIGTSPESAHSNSVTIPSEATAPDAPTAIRAAPVTTGGSANVYWEPNSDGGSAITSYEITVYNGTNVVKTVNASASSKVKYITGLYNGTNYHFTIKAVNSVGTSSESNATNSINPLAKAPSSATSVRAVAGDNSATIYWTRGSENGAPLTSQIITVYSGTTKIGTVTTSGSYSAIRLINSTEGRDYQYTITEVNSIGSSPESAKTNIVTPY